MKKALQVLVLAAGVVAAAGCRDPGPAVVPAKGKVTLNGKPLPAANIGVYYPDNSTASAMTDDQGNFSLSYNGKLGALPGTGLKVTIKKQDHAYQMEGVDPNNPDPNKMTPDAMIQMAKDRGGPGKGPNLPKQLLPENYADPAQSGVTIDIPANGREDIEIKLGAR